MNVLIVEDERKTAELLKELIESKPDYIVVSIQDSIESTVSYLNKNLEKIDLLFLDIQLADGQSFEIFNHIQINIPIIFYKNKILIKKKQPRVRVELTISAFLKIIIPMQRSTTEPRRHIKARERVWFINVLGKTYYLFSQVFVGICSK